MKEQDWQTLARDFTERVRTHAPEWADQSDADPGVTLINVFAFLAEQLVYRANHLPDRARVAIGHAMDNLTTLRGIAREGCGPPARVRFFHGQVLTAEDFETEQTYHRDKRRVHNLWLHGVGVVSGLRVSVEASADGARSVVSVDPGFAIAPDGNELLVCNRLEGFLSMNGDVCLVALRMVERTAKPAVVGSGTEPTRIEEIIEIYLGNDVPDGALTIARLRCREGRWHVDSRFEPVRIR